MGLKDEAGVHEAWATRRGAGSEGSWEVPSEKSIRHLSGENEQAVGYKDLEFRGRTREGMLLTSHTSNEISRGMNATRREKSKGLGPGCSKVSSR